MSDTIAELELVLANEQLEYEGELIDAEATGERPDLNDREVMVPVDWIRELIDSLSETTHTLDFVEKNLTQRLELAMRERDEAKAAFDAHDELLHQVLDERVELRAALADARKRRFGPLSEIFYDWTPEERLSAAKCLAQNLGMDVISTKHATEKTDV